MSYRDWFKTHYGHRSDTDQSIRIYLTDPATADAKTIVWNDTRSASYILECERMIADLKEYRQALAARYAQLETMSYKRLLKLQRVPSWRGSISYFVTITKTLEDGTKLDELRESYEGKERHKAFKRFAELQKQYPGIDAEKDVERRAWER